MKKIVFFGLGAVGSVMACAFAELSKKYHTGDLKLTFITRNPKEAYAYLFRATHMLRSAEIVEVKDFNELFRLPEKYVALLEHADMFVNGSIPKFNEAIIRLAIRFKSAYVDLASDMYNDETLRTLRFTQEKFHVDFQMNRLLGLMNIGASPGLTNFLVGEKMLQLGHSENALRCESIRVYLLEHIDSRQTVFSWSPSTAFEELEEKPRFLQNGRLEAIEPFDRSVPYHFPHLPGSVFEYPIYQEEVLSFHERFPDASSIEVLSGGSEIELIRNLFQLNLLSKTDVQCIADNMSVEKIVRAVLPGLQSPQKMEDLVKKGIISSAHFAAMAEISFSVFDADGERRVLTETTGFGFNRYRELLHTPYSGATYIAYVTGVSAAVLSFFSHEAWKRDAEKCSGMLAAEMLPGKVGMKATDMIKRELSLYMIDFMSHTHSLTTPKP